MSDSKVVVVLGKVKMFDAQLGYGFVSVKADGGAFDIFVHHNTIEMPARSDGGLGFRSLMVGQYAKVHATINPDGTGLISIKTIPEPVPELSAAEAFKILLGGV